MSAQLLSDMRAAVQVLHEFHFGAKRFRAVVRGDDPGTVWMERWCPELCRYEKSYPFAQEEAALILDLAKLAGRLG